MTARASPVFAYHRNPTMVDYPGRLAALFFVSGCNFRCGFCHNAALMAESREGLAWEDLDKACRAFRDHWADAAVITGGEPTLAEGLEELVGRLRGHGFAVKLDTNGSRPEVLERVAPLVDYVAMDVKCSLPTYPRLTGFTHADRIGRSAGILRETTRDYEFRTTVIDGVHTDEEMRGVAEIVRGARRYVLQPFVPREDLPDPALRLVRRTAPSRLRELQAAMRDCADEVICRE